MFKKKEISSKITQIFRPEGDPQPAVPPALAQDLAKARIDNLKNKDFAIELARDVMILFAHATHGKYGQAKQLTAIPYWEGGQAPISLTLIAGSLDQENGVVIPSTIDLEMQNDLASFWKNLEEAAEGAYPIIFDAGTTSFYAFNITAREPEALVALIGAYMGKNRISPLDILQNQAKGNEDDLKRSLGEFNNLAAQSKRPLVEIEAERLLLMPATGLYQYPEEALLHGELNRHVQFEYPHNITSVSLQKLGYLSARARGHDVPYESKGYIIH